MKKAILSIFPNLLDPTLSHNDSFSPSMIQAVSQIDGLIAESEKGGRHFLKRFTFSKDRTFRDISISLLNEHTQNLEELLEPLIKGERWGLISDCGLPCLADPGPSLILLAKKKGIAIETFPGLSSITQALILSGLPAQSFAFHGYLPRKLPLLHTKLRSLETDSFKNRQTQIFIEAPYRSDRLLHCLISILRKEIYLSIASNLTSSDQKVITQPIKAWKKNSLTLGKTPTVFLFCVFR